MTEVFYRLRSIFSTLAIAEAENRVLREGEFWTEQDPATGFSTGRRKVGDGTTPFVDLPFEPGVAGGGADLSDDNPQPLGTPAPGTSQEASRADHVHAMPTAAQVGAASVGLAAGLSIALG